MSRRLLIGAGLALLTSAAVAKELPRRQAEEPPKRASACAYLGQGYVKAPDSDTCIKISGSVRAEGSVNFGR